MIINVISKSKSFRDNVNTEFKHQFSLAVKLGEEVSTVSSVPRLANRQSRFRPNLENDDLLSYYIRTLAIPFFDDIDSQVEYSLKDRNHINIFARLQPQFTVDILLVEYHNKMVNEGAHFLLELRRWYNFRLRKLNDKK